MRPFAGDIEASHDPEFKDAITSIQSTFHIEEIVETGTNLGLGSTKVFAETGLPVYTLECNPTIFAQAVENLKHYKNVTCINAYSLPYKDMTDFINQDNIYNSNLDIMVDGPGDHRTFYHKELGPFNIKENILPSLINNNQKQIIFLDSAGGIGYLEYTTVMTCINNNIGQYKILILDDCLHVKHYRSIMDLEKRGYVVHKSKSARWAWIHLTTAPKE